MKTNTQTGPLLGPVDTYPNIFESGDFSLPFQKKKKHPHVTYPSPSRPPIRYGKQWKYDSISHRACVMIVVSDE